MLRWSGEIGIIHSLLKMISIAYLACVKRERELFGRAMSQRLTRGDIQIALAVGGRLPLISGKPLSGLAFHVKDDRNVLHCHSSTHSYCTKNTSS